MLSLVALCLLAAAASAQVKMSVVVGGKTVGQATLTQKLLADGGKLVQVAMEMSSDGRSIKVRQETTYRADGSAARKFSETTVPGQRFRRQVVATYGSKEVTVVDDRNGQRQTSRVPLPPGAKLANPSEFWVVKTKPATGATVEVDLFMVDRLEWKRVQVVYGGLKEIKVGGKAVKAHVSTSEIGSAFLDDIGMPVRLELPGVRMDRIWTP